MKSIAAIALLAGSAAAFAPGSSGKYMYITCMYVRVVLSHGSYMYLRSRYSLSHRMWLGDSSDPPGGNVFHSAQIRSTHNMC